MGLNERMERTDAIAQMRATCNQIGGAITALHSHAPALAHPATQAEILKALFELTRQLEVVKKHLIRLEKGDGSTLV